ncbi:hypothetical protein [Burkholderia plantarii]|uniref:hypothetical protein n=1 Tax=Burkholderia plantarii TaxID=41899 RepID=UPI0006D8BB79|nr:hypothetical protein [Burkholderia plantarii]ALK32947.1 glycosyl transferase family protein [Burkholderia plantarii]GLZ20379.1 glycosyl transferase [Burkholderia plantarii]
MTEDMQFDVAGFRRKGMNVANLEKIGGQVRVVMLAGYDAASDRCAVGEYGECLAAELSRRAGGTQLDFTRIVFKPGSTLGWFALPDAVRNASIVHVQYPYEGWGRSPLAGLLGAVAKRGLPWARTKVATTFHEWRSMHWLRKLSILPLAFSSDLLIFVSKRERDSYLRSAVGRLRGAWQRIEVIPIGVNVKVPPIDRTRVTRERAAMLGDASGRPGVLLGFFGFIYDWKQPVKLLDALAALIRTGVNARLLICGDFPDGHDAAREQFRADLRARNLLDHVIHEGYVEDETTLAHWLAACDAHLYLYKDGVSSRRGSFWYSLELGATVICTPPEYPGEFDGLIDIDGLQHSGAIRFVGPDVEPAVLAHAIADLPAFDAPRRATAHAPSWGAIADRHRSAYAALVNGRARPD